MSSKLSLKEQLEKKRKEVQEQQKNQQATKKYKTRGEIEKEELEKKEAEKKKIQDEKDKKLLEEKLEKERIEKEKQENNNTNQNDDNQSNDKEKKPFLPKNQVIKRLRLRGHPITYFGETEIMRAERLRLLEENEPIEYHQGENEFAKYLKELEEKNKSGNKSEDQKRNNEVQEDEEGLKEEASKSRYGNIYYFLWKLLKDWEEELESRPEDEKKSRQGKNATVTFYQCTVHIKPLFKLLKSKELPDDILAHIHLIVEYCKEREYVKANDQYLQMAIGNAPWPMGVTMVGIHERSSREKIFSNQVAHVLNDETQRKYIQGVKRLMTFCQTIHPANPSKCVK